MDPSNHGIFQPHFADSLFPIANDGDVGNLPSLVRLGVRSGTKLTSSWWEPQDVAKPKSCQTLCTLENSHGTQKWRFGR